jgi:hypothetical protein
MIRYGFTNFLWRGEERKWNNQEQFVSLLCELRIFVEED